MKTSSSLLGKIFGWAQFGLAVINDLAQPGHLPNGLLGWLQLAGSLLTGIALHHASSTDGTK